MKLRQYQTDAVQRLVTIGKAILAYPIGSGKSTIALHAVMERGALPVLIVCPATLKYVWKEEILKWEPEARVYVAEGGKGKIDPQASFVIVNYELLRRRFVELWTFGFKAIVGDEAHALKDAASQRSEAFRNLAANLQTVFLLTATPMMNRPEELIHPLQVIGRLGQFGGRTEFEKKYCEAQQIYQFGRRIWWTGGADNLEELREKLLFENSVWSGPCMLRVAKKDILPELPDDEVVRVPVTIPNMKEYVQARDNFIEWWNGEMVGLGKKALAEGESDALAHAVAELSEDVQPGVQALRLRQVVGRGKVPLALDWIKDFLADTDEKLIVFAHFRETQKDLFDGLQKDAVGVTQLTSDMDALFRSLAIQQFQNNPGTRVIVCGIMVAGAGITLTAASTSLFVEESYVPVLNEQARGRMNRIGQTSDKTLSFVLSAKDTIDQRIARVGAAKQKVIDASLGGS